MSPVYTGSSKECLVAQKKNIRTKRWLHLQRCSKSFYALFRFALKSPGLSPFPMKSCFIAYGKLSKSFLIFSKNLPLLKFVTFFSNSISTPQIFFFQPKQSLEIERQSSCYHFILTQGHTFIHTAFLKLRSQLSILLLFL